MPVEFDPDNFNLERLRTNYLDFGIVFNNLDAILQGVLITISLALLAEVLAIPALVAGLDRRLQRPDDVPGPVGDGVPLQHGWGYSNPEYDDLINQAQDE